MRSKSGSCDQPKGVSVENGADRGKVVEASRWKVFKQYHGEEPPSIGEQDHGGGVHFDKRRADGIPREVGQDASLLLSGDRMRTQVGVSGGGEERILSFS